MQPLAGSKAWQRNGQKDFEKVGLFVFVTGFCSTNRKLTLKDNVLGKGDTKSKLRIF